MAIGKLGDPTKLPERKRKEETRGGTKKPLKEQIFHEKWEKSINFKAESEKNG